MKKVLIVGIVLFILFSVMKTKKMFTKLDAENAIRYAAKKYGKDFASKFEKVLRLETAHFTSKQYQQTGTAGMEVGAWGKRFQKAGVTTQGVIEAVEGGTGIIKRFLILPSVNAFADLFYSYIQDNPLQYWNSKEPLAGQIYLDKLAKINTPITDKI